MPWQDAYLINRIETERWERQAENQRIARGATRRRRTRAARRAERQHGRAPATRCRLLRTS